jgi:hypothetical protein
MLKIVSQNGRHGVSVTRLAVQVLKIEQDITSKKVPTPIRAVMEA